MAVSTLACAIKMPALASGLATICRSRQSTSFVQKGGAVYANAARGARVSMTTDERPMWLPGVEAPPYLNGSLPADRGFDPLKLAEDPRLATRFVEAEVFHGRLAMLATVGAFVPEAIGREDWYTAAHKAIDAGGSSFILAIPPFAIPTSYLGIGLFHLVAIVELSRLFREAKNGYDDDIEGVGIYPGFDPLGLTTGEDVTADEIKILREKEIKNGRLAMIAAGGFLHQALHTGKGPYANLIDHLADPSHNWYFGS
ncbi:light harvesting chlorophyll a b-binding protein [Klebsormidium nitens]|uniref:Chlorophyll a-b binding protein, chloroplastic n=1 Tax=Klebsormidium nitens TaxID=105231 RepID=A0A1Y1IFJ9_KLENI|nr:light harvesting chlorophyll a b-binding protein [Klebsormidium nitens]|eukprot:GAQ89393.1 light harvesting chlorophyll a b-binding protein [Klebsormidium nitens]